MRFLLLSLVLFGQVASATNKADYLCNTALNLQPLDYANHFSPHIVEAIPESAFMEQMKDIVNAVGLCKRFQLESESNGNFVFKFSSSSDRSITLKFSLDTLGRIDSLGFVNTEFPDVVINDWNAANSYLGTWKGRASLSIINFDGQRGSQRLGQQAHPIASVFKLYVLGALADAVGSNSLQWNQEFPIKDEWKSLPSGIMQDWPAGKMVSLKEYATNMISISDNTATDHLMNILGRGKVESQLPLMLNGFSVLNRPLLTTAEMFKIKWAVPLSVSDAFVTGDEAARRNILMNEVAGTPLSAVGTNGVDDTKPTRVREIEWFTSTGGMCRAMFKLKEKGSPEVMGILSKNVPIINTQSNSPWTYAGFKGGSEPGVITMAFLLQNRNAEWGCVSIAWNNTTETVNPFIFHDFMGKAFKLAESYFR